MNMPSGPVFNIVGKKVALGPLRKDLLPLYQRWINDLESARNLGGYRPFAFEEEEKWYARLLESEDIFFTVYDRDGAKPVGTASLSDIDYRNRRAEFGIFIGERGARGKGLGTETTRLMLDYAFAAVGLHNVHLRVFAFNKAAIRAYKKAGFKEYGRRREAYLMNGRMWDDVHMDCISTEFETPALREAFPE
jgi:RimJ/RimL family protein N-acetyltransferase